MELKLPYKSKHLIKSKEILWNRIQIKLIQLEFVLPNLKLKQNKSKRKLNLKVKFNHYINKNLPTVSK